MPSAVTDFAASYATVIDDFELFDAHQFFAPGVIVGSMNPTTSPPLAASVKTLSQQFCLLHPSLTEPAPPGLGFVVADPDEDSEPAPPGAIALPKNPDTFELSA